LRRVKMRSLASRYSMTVARGEEILLGELLLLVVAGQQEVEPDLGVLFTDPGKRAMNGLLLVSLSTVLAPIL
jgi:hypothetical protein